MKLFPQVKGLFGNDVEKFAAHETNPRLDPSLAPSLAVTACNHPAVDILRRQARSRHWTKRASELRQLLLPLPTRSCLILHAHIAWLRLAFIISVQSALIEP